MIISCKDCGSEELYRKAWVRYDTGSFGDWAEDSEETAVFFCENCEEFVDVLIIL